MRSLVSYSILVALCVAIGAHGLSAVHADNAMAQLYGAMRMQYGINALTGQEANISFVNYTYTGGQTWTVNGQQFVVPDQLGAAPQSKQETLAVESLGTNFSSLFAAYKGQYHFSGSGGGSSSGTKGAFSGATNHSSELITIKAYLNASSNSSVEYGYSTFSIRYYSLDFEPAFILPTSNAWTNAVAALPKTIKTSADKDAYKTFVETFGTHYTSYGLFGGYVHSITFVNQSVIAKYGGSTVVSAMQSHFSSYLAKITGSSSNLDASSWYDKDTKTYNFVRGGNETMAKDGSGDWLATVSLKPGLVSSTLSSLSNLVLTDATKQETLDTYIKSYIADGGKK